MFRFTQAGRIAGIRWTFATATATANRPTRCGGEVPGVPSFHTGRAVGHAAPRSDAGRSTRVRAYLFSNPNSARDSGSGVPLKATASTSRRPVEQ